MEILKAHPQSGHSSAEPECRSRPAESFRFPCSGHGWALLLFLLARMMATGSAFGAGIVSYPEYQVKAAYLYQFGKYVEWPQDAFLSPATPITIGILGKDPFGADIDLMVRNKTAGGREVVIKRFNDVQAVKSCHVLFVSAEEEKRLPEVLEVIKNLSVLTVGETAQFTKAGGVIRLTPEDRPEGRRVGIEINLEAAARARLVLSSHLLLRAKIIRPSPAERKE